MVSSLGWSKLFSMPNGGGVQLHLRIRNSPDALTLGDAGLLTTTRRGEPGPSIEELGDLSIDHVVTTGELASSATMDNRIIGGPQNLPDDKTIKRALRTVHGG